MRSAEALTPLRYRLPVPVAVAETVPKPPARMTSPLPAALSLAFEKLPPSMYS